MRKIYDRAFFKSKTREAIRWWISTHRIKLVGSAVFTKSNSLTAKIVAWAEGWRCEDKDELIPSHTGSIVEKDGEILIFDMKPPRASVQNLEKYLWTTDEDFVLILRDFRIDADMFSSVLLNDVGQGYPYMSAIRSVFSKRETKWNCHCSELHARTLELCGYKFDDNFKLECTPDELMHYMIDRDG